MNYIYLRISVSILAIGIPSFCDAAITKDNCNLTNAQKAVASFSGDQITTINGATWFAGGATEDGQAVNPRNPTLPEHCAVTGVIDPHLGDPDNTQYGNNFKLRIPANWNSRFFFQGGGGNNGTVGNAAGGLKDGKTALDLGYAVVAQDSGHKGSEPTFALDKKAYNNFSYQSVHDVSQISKAILKTVTGSAPKYSYFVGCSNGGREALVSAQQYDDFDGVVAGAPAYAAFDQWTQNISMMQVAAKLSGVQSGVVPTDTSKAFSDAQLAYAGNYFKNKCDKLDGIVDGVISNFSACKADAADFSALQCKAYNGKISDENCLNAAQIKGLGQIYTGAQNSTGKLLFPGFIPGQIEHHLRDTYLGKAGSAFPLGSLYNAIMANFYYMGYGWQAYPNVTGAANNPASYPQSALAYVNQFNFDAEPPKLAGRSHFQASNVEVNNPGPNYENFKKRGGKILMYTGSADPAVQAKGVTQLMDKLNAQYTPAVTAKMARLFVVPGMNHCRGGDSTDQFDELAPLVAWVEKGVAPEKIIAKAQAGNALDKNMPGVSRPLCVYPKFAKYMGKGDKASADSFVCVKS